MKRFPEVEDLVLKVFKNDMISISILEAEDVYVEATIILQTFKINY